MQIFIVMRDLGDGDVGLRYFSTEEIADRYIQKNEEECYYESNPRMIETDNFEFDDEAAL